MRFVLLHVLYPLLYTAGLILYSPVLGLRVVRGTQSWNSILQRAGWLPEGLRKLRQARSGVWIHAVSVGEVASIRSLIARLALPADRLFVSTTTETGQALARDLYSDRAHIFFFPLDFKFACRRYLRAISPALVILTETELWPSFLHSVEKAGVPLLLVNGRISDRSLRRYMRIRTLSSWMLNRFCKLGMQSRQDRDRARQLGAPGHRTHWIGNLKFDYSLPDHPRAGAAARRIAELLGRDEGHLLWVCGSTHEGEEAILMEVFQALRQEFTQLRWVLAPRHPERFDAVTRTLQEGSVRVARRSQLPASGEPAPEAVVVDSIGELPYLYEIADLVFVGGSLTPVGGHNLIEAAHFKKPILFGPHMENFREIAEVFLRSYAALQVHSGSELQVKMRELLRDASTRRWLGGNARRVIRDNQGAVGRTVDLVQDCAPGVVPTNGGSP